MNKIINWTFGSIFRTLGRLIVYFGIGALIFLILSKNDFKIIDFIMPMVVNAETVEYTLETNQSLVCVDRAGTQSCTSYVNNPHNVNPTYPVELIKFRVRLDTSWSSDNVYTFNVGYRATPDAIAVPYQVQIEINDTFQDVTNTQWTLNSSGYYRSRISVQPNVTYSQQYLYIYLRFNPAYLTEIRPSLLDNITISTSTDAVIKDQTNQIINQQEQTNQNLEDLNNSLNDSDVDGASDSASSFFSDFTSDDFGLSSIITAPLDSIKKLLNSSCSPLVVPLPFVNSNLNLPCMTSIYSNYFGDFFNIYQIITTGLISYYIIVRIFNLVKDFKNPEHDEIEVVDL